MEEDWLKESPHQELLQQQLKEGGLPEGTEIFFWLSDRAAIVETPKEDRGTIHYPALMSLYVKRDSEPFFDQMKRITMHFLPNRSNIALEEDSAHFLRLYYQENAEEWHDSPYPPIEI